MQLGTKIDYDQEDTIRELLLGRKVKVEGHNLILDNGTVLEVLPNEGCGGCSEGWFDITELNDVDNAILHVDFIEEGRKDEEGFDREYFGIFVYSEVGQMKLLEVEGHDNGYYGVGYKLRVRKVG